MKYPIYQVDAFTSELFGGNPAAVVLMQEFPTDRLMQAVAAENNLAETAFLIPTGADYQLRWFTPTVEAPLCGHATLASAAVILERLGPQRDGVVFPTASGALTVRRAASTVGYARKILFRHSAPGYDVPPSWMNSKLTSSSVEQITLQDR